MPSFRLSYPAHIYVSVEAETLSAARKILVDVLKEVQDGIIIGLYDDGVEGEILYPDSNKKGEVDTRKVAVEDIEG